MYALTYLSNGEWYPICVLTVNTSRPEKSNSKSSTY